MIDRLKQTDDEQTHTHRLKQTDGGQTHTDRLKQTDSNKQMMGGHTQTYRKTDFIYENLRIDRQTDSGKDATLRKDTNRCVANTSFQPIVLQVNGTTFVKSNLLISTSSQGQG